MNIDTVEKTGRTPLRVSAQEKETPYAQLKEVPVKRELLVLYSLSKSGRSGVYGLDIQRAVEECSGGAVKISDGSLYSLLKRLRRKAYVDSYEGNAVSGGAKRHYYFLTDKGAALVNASNTFFDELQGWSPE
ncbi:MAG: PadR family transcriptional regulator [Cyanobacteria bacterium J06607_10]